MAWLTVVTVCIFSLVTALIGLRAYQSVEEEAYRAINQVIVAVDAAQSYVRHVARPKAVETLGEDAFIREFMSTSYVGRNIADRILEHYSDYYFKFATLKPHNERNRADDRERDIIERFKADPNLKEWRGVIKRGGKSYLSVATPIRTTPDCMVCHSTLENAPAELRRYYADADGWGYDDDEVSIKSVGVLLQETTATSLRNAFFMLSPILGLILLLLVAANVLFNRFVTTPINTLRNGARKIRSGEYGHRIAQLHDREFTALAGSFNEMAASIEQDIEARKQAELSMSEAKMDAVYANKAKSEFLASMSHELRTPLNAVLGYAQMLQYNPSTPLTETQSQYIDSIVSGGNHLLELVNDILDLAKIESNQINLTITEVDVCTVVNDTIAMAEQLGKARAISIDNRIDCVDTRLRTDEVRLKQVVLNLLTNAIKFNRDNGSVIINAKSVTPGFLRIFVTDTGCGIPEEDRASVFHMFRRLEDDVMIAREGIGIGLSVSKLLIERMAGRIGVDSVVGEGSTFWVELPLIDNDNVMIWTDALTTHIDPIDNDHQVLIALWSKTTFHDTPVAEVDEIIEDIVNYSKYHFRREEAIMEACTYPGLEAHKSQHRRLLEQVNELVVEWNDTRDPKTVVRLRKFLQKWLFDHILKMDTLIHEHADGKEEAIKKALENLTSQSVRLIDGQ